MVRGKKNLKIQKWVIKSRISDNRQHNGQKKKVQNMMID
jgi:hypothetical protein